MRYLVACDIESTTIVTASTRASSCPGATWTPYVSRTRNQALPTSAILPAGPSISYCVVDDVALDLPRAARRELDVVALAERRDQRLLDRRDGAGVGLDGHHVADRDELLLDQVLVVPGGVLEVQRLADPEHLAVDLEHPLAGAVLDPEVVADGHHLLLHLVDVGAGSRRPCRLCRHVGTCWEPPTGILIDGRTIPSCAARRVIVRSGWDVAARSPGVVPCRPRRILRAAPDQPAHRLAPGRGVRRAGRHAGAVPVRPRGDSGPSHAAARVGEPRRRLPQPRPPSRSTGPPRT